VQFFVTLTLEQLTSSPAELQSAMTEFVEDEVQKGAFVITGGLASHADGARVELSPSGMLQNDALLALSFKDVPPISALAYPANRAPDWPESVESQRVYQMAAGFDLVWSQQ
jgi:hypothetical protein